MYGHGISQTGEIIDRAVEKDIVNKSGSWYSYQDERIGQGRENAKKYLDEHTDMKQEIRQKVRAAYNMDAENSEPEEVELAMEADPQSTTEKP